MFKQILLAFCGLILITGMSVPAFSRGAVPVRPDDAVAVAQPGFTKLYGEILYITNDRYILRCGEELISGKLTPAAKFFCNGMPAVWEALLPVYDEAYFEAEVLVNRLKETVSINGFYTGEELIIKSWSYQREKLLLRLKQPDQGTVVEKYLADDARLPKGDWLRTDQPVYLLYNIHGEARAVFLPD